MYDLIRVVRFRRIGPRLSPSGRARRIAQPLVDHSTLVLQHHCESAQPGLGLGDASEPCLPASSMARAEQTRSDVGYAHRTQATSISGGRGVRLAFSPPCFQLGLQEIGGRHSAS